MRVVFLIVLIVTLMSCSEYDNPSDLKNWREWSTTRTLYGAVFDSATAVGLDSVLIAQKRSVPVIVPDSYFDSLARIDAPLGRFMDSCSIDTLSKNGSIEMV